ncbi:MAG: DUF465 domain-containing protein [Desulfohalobiaceae bacterium]|nr:DUF465 domain-containing protein [Desulfohalobiaceae bacterium]
MEQHEIDMINKYIESDTELKKLWEEHIDFENKLQDLESKRHLTPAEQAEIKRLKRDKLTGKTKIQYKLDKYMTQETS